MSRLPPIDTRTDTLCPYTTLFRAADRAAGGRTTVNPLFDLARAVQLLIQAFCPQEAATRIRLECGAIISVRERVAHVIAFPRPACLGDRHSVYDAGLGTLNADFSASIGPAQPVAAAVAAALEPSGDDLICAARRMPCGTANRAALNCERPDRRR